MDHSRRGQLPEAARGEVIAASEVQYEKKAQAIELLRKIA